MSEFVEIEPNTVYKLCKDCEHCTIPLIYNIFNKWIFAKCKRNIKKEPKILEPSKIDLITGKIRKSIKESLPYCDLERFSNRVERCGKEATFFKPKRKGNKYHGKDV